MLISTTPLQVNRHMVNRETQLLVNNWALSPAGLVDPESVIFRAFSQLLTVSDALTITTVRFCTTL